MDPKQVLITLGMLLLNVAYSTSVPTNGTVSAELKHAIHTLENAITLVKYENAKYHNELQEFTQKSKGFVASLQTAIKEHLHKTQITINQTAATAKEHGFDPAQCLREFEANINEKLTQHDAHIHKMAEDFYDRHLTTWNVFNKLLDGADARLIHLQNDALSCLNDDCLKEVLTKVKMNINTIKVETYQMTLAEYKQLVIGEVTLQNDAREHNTNLVAYINNSEVSFRRCIYSNAV